MTDVVENDILNGNYSLFQKVLYGGVSHGVVIIPTHVLKLLFTLIFPPLGEVISCIGEFISDTFPWVTWEALKKLVEYKILNRIIYSFVLTSLFYIPGLIYTLSNLTTNTPNVPGTLICTPDGNCMDSSELTKTPTKAN